MFRFGGEIDPDTSTDLDSAWYTIVEDPVVCAGGSHGLCDKVYRWNLDRVEDLNGNGVSFDYTTEVGWYDAEGDNAVFYREDYIRAGHVGEILYTQRPWNQTNARVVFTAEERCTPGTSCVWPTDYPDTPGDLECASTGTCSQLSPTFWSKYRLGSIQTLVWDSSPDSWTPTGFWRLDHTFPTPPPDSDGDPSEPKLWLDDITRLYPDGTGTGLPPTAYSPTMLDNRLNHPSGVSAMTMPRVSQVTTPLGGAVAFTYGQPHACEPGVVYDFSDHHWDCFPGYDPYTGSGDWVVWNKWKVDELSEDGSFGNPTVVTAYDYGPPAWHHEQDPVKPASLQSWNDFRGHPWVTVTGADGIISEFTFYQGMHGDKTATGGTKAVNITLSDSTTRTDSNWLTGRAAESRVLEGTEAVSRQVTEYGAQSTAGSGTYGAYLINPTQQIDTNYGEAVTKTTRTDYSYDVYGNQTLAVLHGDMGTTADDRVISRSFKTNLGLWLVDRPAFEKLWAGTTPGIGSVHAATVFGYDSDATAYLTGTPTRGNLTTLRSYLTPASFVDEDYTYDFRGRLETVTDAESNTTSLTYHGLFGTLFTETNPLSHVTAYGYDNQARLVTVTDPNSHVTTVGYDNYGRVTEVWEPTESTSGTATRSYAYSLAGSPAWTRTRALTEVGTVDAYTYVDGLGRVLQTQTKTASGRSLVSTQTNDMGRTLYVSHPYAMSGAPGAGLVAPVWTTVPTYTKSLYDPLGRVERTDLMALGVSQAHTTTTQDGWVTKQVDANGNRTDQESDGFGNLVEVTEYNGLAVYATTSYGYNLRNNLVSVTDADSNLTSISYNLLGWKTAMSDPDMGSWTYSYDNTGQLITQKDGKNQTLWFGLDDLGRVTERRQTNGSGTLLAEYSYDATGQKGLLFWSKSYTPEGTVQVTNTAYDARDRVTDRRWVIPGTGGGTYALQWDYDPTDQVVSVTYPGNNTGGLGEKVTTGFNLAAQPVSLLSDTSESYVISTAYHPDGRPIDQQLAAGAITRFTDMDHSTQRVDEWRAGTGTGVANLADLRFDHDPAGNITTTTDGANGGQRQCFFYDHRQRLTFAKTGTEAGTQRVCYYRDTTRGEAPYELVYTYNPIGNLTQVQQNYPTSSTETYTYGSAGPHAVTAIGSDTYTYDNNGDLTGRTVNSVSDTLTWDYDRRLRQVTGGGDTTAMIYDADGNRVARTDPSGRSVYVGDWYETRTETTTTHTSHYWAAGTRVASRTDTQPTLYLTTDPQSSVVATFTRDDQVWANFSTNPGWSNQLVGDFNGDGKQDIANYHAGSGGWWVSKSTGSSFTTGLWVTLPAGSWVTHLAGDFTGDGKTDLAHFRDSDGTWWVSKSTGTGFTTSLWADFSTTVGWGPQLVGDFTGDGKDDIANHHAASGTWWVSKSTGTSFTTTKWYTLPAGSWVTHVAGDFTGDGKTDLAHFRDSDGTWWVSKSTGTGFIHSQWANFGTNSGWTAQPVGDYNGDGKDDIGNFHPSNGTWWISRSTGSSFTTSLWADFSTASGWISQVPADVNGDGKTDLLNHHPGGGSWWASVSSGSGFTTHRSNLTATGNMRLAGDYTGDNKDDLATFSGLDGSWWTATTLATAAYQTDQQYYHPYGQIRATDNPDTDLAYTGQRLDDTTDLMYYNARYYNPTTRRFISPDTIIPNPTNPQNLNRYTYTLSNPTNHTDPTGHCYVVSTGPDSIRIVEPYAGACVLNGALAIDSSELDADRAAREELVASRKASFAEAYPLAGFSAGQDWMEYLANRREVETLDGRYCLGLSCRPQAVAEIQDLERELNGYEVLHDEAKAVSWISGLAVLACAVAKIPCSPAFTSAAAGTFAASSLTSSATGITLDAGPCFLKGDSRSCVHGSISLTGVVLGKGALRRFGPVGSVVVFFAFDGADLAWSWTAKGRGVWPD